MDPAPVRTVAAGVPVLVAMGMVGVAMGSSALAMIVPEMAVHAGVPAALLLASPAPLWWAARWFAPTTFHADYAGVRIGRKTIPACSIVSADLRRDADPARRVVMLLLDDGRILRTPPVEPEVAEAVCHAYARPADFFAGQLAAADAAERLAGVRPAPNERAGQENSPL